MLERAAWLGYAIERFLLAGEGFFIFIKGPARPFLGTERVRAETFSGGPAVAKWFAVAVRGFSVPVERLAVFVKRFARAETFSGGPAVAKW
ncbi:MAG: hypothetical protein PHW69_01275, partial [Elusimicrobiaceae bacterium]|nr:hypothetical protein [Elusimicrobiaceae bacterium]